MNEIKQLEQETKQSQRHSYLLRVWRANRTVNASWHASLEDTRTKERVGFANIEQLFAYLMALIERDDKRAVDQAKEKS